LLVFETDSFVLNHRSVKNHVREIREQRTKFLETNLSVVNRLFAQRRDLFQRVRRFRVIAAKSVFYENANFAVFFFYFLEVVYRLELIAALREPAIFVFTEMAETQRRLFSDLFFYFLVLGRHLQNLFVLGPVFHENVLVTLERQKIIADFFFLVVQHRNVSDTANSANVEVKNPVFLLRTNLAYVHIYNCQQFLLHLRFLQIYSSRNIFYIWLKKQFSS
jgi:hypothetical protein